MKFRSDEDGFITALRFYKQPNNTGTHVGHLWSGTGPAARGGHLHGRDRVGLAGGASSRTPCRSRRTPRTSTSYYAASGRYGVQPRLLQPGRRPRAAARAGATAVAAATASTTTAPARSPTRASTPPTTGSTRASTGPSRRTRAGRRSRTVLRPVGRHGRRGRPPTVTATFDEQLAPASVTGANFTLRDEDGNLVAGRRDLRRADARRRSSKPAVGARRTPRPTWRGSRAASGGVTDAAGNPLAADKTWTFTTEAQSPGRGPGRADPGDRRPGRPVRALLRRDPARPRASTSSTSTDGPVTAAKLAGHDTVILASAARHRRRGGAAHELGAGRRQPDRDAARTRSSPGLLGLTDAGGTRANQYLKVDTGQRRRRRDRRRRRCSSTAPPTATRSTAPAAIARLYSDAATRDLGRRRSRCATWAPAAARRRRSPTTSRARSSTRARATRPGRARSATARPTASAPNDLFYGAKAGDVQPDWVDMSKIDVPQADEQQRLLANLITEMNRDKAPLPRFWYLPRGEKAAVVETGDDHAQRRHARRSSTGSRPRARPAARWPTGSACARRRTSTPTPPMTDAQAAALRGGRLRGGAAPGHRLGCQDFTPASLEERPHQPAVARSRPPGRASRSRRPTAPTASSGATGPPSRRSRRRTASASTRTTTTTAPPAG